MRHLAAVFLCLLSTSSVAGAADMTERRKLASEYVEIAGLRGVYDESAARCAKPASALESDLLSLAVKHPAQFEGISQGTPYWQEALDIYAQYINTHCTSISGKKLQPLFVAAYAQEMTEEQLKTAIAFYATPAGKALSAGSRAVTLAVTAAASQAAELALDNASGIYLQAMKQLQSRAGSQQ